MMPLRFKQHLSDVDSCTSLQISAHDIDLLSNCLVLFVAYCDCLPAEQWENCKLDLDQEEENDDQQFKLQLQTAQDHVPLTKRLDTYQRLCWVWLGQAGGGSRSGEHSALSHSALLSSKGSGSSLQSGQALLAHLLIVLCF